MKMRTPSAAGSSGREAKTTACCSKIGLKKGPWTPEEDQLLSNYINKQGVGKWRTLPKQAGLLRCGKSCRLRWMNYLRPCVKRGHIAPDEEDLILRLHRLLGNRWSLIAGRIPGRTDNEIKNYWNTHLSKKLISQGIDPTTHKPLDPLSINQFKLASSSSSKPINRKSSSSSPNIVHEFNNTKKINHSRSGVQETTTGSATPVYYGGIDSGVINRSFHGYTAKMLNCSDEMGIVRTTNHVNVEGIISGGDHEDVNCCSDDGFSTFLNSLINEEPFTAQQQQQQVFNGILPHSDPFISVTTGGWDSSLLSSNSNPNDHLHLHPSN